MASSDEPGQPPLASEGEQHAAIVKTKINAAADNLLRNKLNMVSLIPCRGKLIGTNGILFCNESRRHDITEPLRGNPPTAV